jgi:hypothetical protein
MPSIVRSSFIAMATLLCSMLGTIVHHLFASEITSSHDIIFAIAGLVGTLFSIVLGLLVSSSYTGFNNHQSDLNDMVSALAYIDFLLRKIGSASQESRRLLHAQAAQIKERYWPGGTGTRRRDITYQHLASDIKLMTAIEESVDISNVHHHDDLNDIRKSCRSVIEIQSDIIRSLSNAVPTLLLVVVFSWACLLFFLYGVISGGNFFVILPMLFGSIAIASTNFLILEMTDPYRGVFRIQSSALDLLLQSLNEDKELYLGHHPR